MIKKTNLLITGLTMVLVLSLFMFSGSTSDAAVEPGVYHFFGRVMNQADKPVGNCNVLLVKRLAQAEKKQTEEMQTVVTDETVVAVTSLEGSYFFSFEPNSANDFWVFFMADGYKTRSMELNTLMKSRFFSKPNKSPIKIDVILEKN